MTDQSVNGWIYRQEGKGIEAIDPQGTTHHFATWQAFWNAAGIPHQWIGPTPKTTNPAVVAMMVFFWLHNGLFFLFSVDSVVHLLLRGETSERLTALLLAWIAGALVFGFGGVLAGLAVSRS